MPKLLEMLRLKGTIVTTDALNCQRAIAQQIVDQGGDYALALKGNQGTLHHDVALFLDDPASKVTTAEPVVDADHGRIETRTATVSTDIAWLIKAHQWPGLAAVSKVERIANRRQNNVRTAYYLLSAPLRLFGCCRSRRQPESLISPLVRMIRSGSGKPAVLEMAVDGVGRDVFGDGFGRGALPRFFADEIATASAISSRPP